MTADSSCSFSDELPTPAIIGRMWGMRRSGFDGALHDSVWYAALIGGCLWVLELVRSTLGMQLSGPDAMVAWCGVGFIAAAVMSILLTRRIPLLAFGLTLTGAMLMVSVVELQQGQAIIKPIYAAVSPAVLLPATFAHRALARVLILSTAVVLFVELLIVVPDTILAWNRSFYVVTWSAVIALFVTWLLGLLRTSAQAIDESVVARVAAVKERSIVQARSDEIARLGRLLHDTVINTFIAIRDGVPVGLEPQLRQRCQADLDKLERSQLGSGAGVSEVETTPVAPVALTELLATCAEQARIRGLDPTVCLVGSDRFIPADVAVPLAEIANEALTNSARHSGQTAVCIEARSFGQDVTVAIRDSGVGFDPALADVGGFDPSGHTDKAGGIEGSMRSVARQAGLEFAVISRPGAGVEVLITGRTGSTSSAHPAAGSILPIRGGRMLWLLWSLAGLQVLVQSPGQPLIDVLMYVAGAALIAAALWVALRLANRGEGLPVVGAIGLILAGAVGAWASGVGQALCGPSPYLWVGSTPTLIAIAALAVLASRAGWLVAAWGAGLIALAVLAFAGQSEQCSATVTILDGSQAIALVLGAVFVVAARRTQRGAAQASMQLQQAAAALSRERARAGRYERRITAAMQIAGPLLTRVVAGTANPHDAVVRQEAQRKETLLRSLSQLPELNDRWDREMLRLLVKADQRGVPLRATFSESFRSAQWWNEPASSSSSGPSSPDVPVLAAADQTLSQLSGGDQQTDGDRLALNFDTRNLGGGAAVGELTGMPSRPMLAAVEVHSQPGPRAEMRLVVDRGRPGEFKLDLDPHLDHVSVVTDEQIAVIVTWSEGSQSTNG